MKHIFQIYVIKIVGVILIILVNFIACDDNSTGPGSVREYVFYFNDASYPDRYYRYHSVTRKVDSLTIPYGSWKGFAVSSDGTKLYLSDDAKTVVVSTDSFEVITEIPYSGDISVSPNNELISILGDDIHILSTSDYSLVFSDTDKAGAGIFSTNSRIFFCRAGWDPDAQGPYAYRVDLSDTLNPVTRITFSDGGVLRIVPSTDESKWFLYLRFATFGYAFEEYDVNLDSIIFREFLTPGAGDIEITPNGKYVFYTNPGTLLIGPPSDTFVTIFDILKKEIFKRITTPSPVNVYLIPRNLAISPDGRKMVAIGARGQGEFVIIDVTTLEVSEHYYLGNSVDIWNIICQNSL